MSLLQFSNQLPKVSSLGPELVLVYDKVLDRKVPGFRRWRQSFSASYGVEAGEDLKAVEKFPGHISKVVSLCDSFSSRQLKLVVVGGGSVGDFGGFVASVLKRGVGLIHIPSTWLAAIDSAHGGKTALNVGKAKNQIGTFYPAEKVILIKSLLLAQSSARAFEGFSELLKVALLSGGRFWQQLRIEKKISNEVLWRHLPQAIEGKLKIVKKDPRETKGLRHQLNLGHTMGHVFESYYELPHGIAVNYGMEFALRWSAQKKLMNASTAQSLEESPVMTYLLSAERDHLLNSNAGVLRAWRKLLLRDKKKSSAQKLRFIFLIAPGKPVVKDVFVDEVLLELCRQQEEELYA